MTINGEKLNARATTQLVREQAVPAAGGKTTKLSPVPRLNKITSRTSRQMSIYVRKPFDHPPSKCQEKPKRFKKPKMLRRISKDNTWIHGCTPGMGQDLANCWGAARVLSGLTPPQARHWRCQPSVESRTRCPRRLNLFSSPLSHERRFSWKANPAALGSLFSSSQQSGRQRCDIKYRGTFAFPSLTYADLLFFFQVSATTVQLETEAKWQMHLFLII